MTSSFLPGGRLTRMRYCVFQFLISLAGFVRGRHVDLFLPTVFVATTAHLNRCFALTHGLSA